mmetsp:Transcript_9386/g.15318  ORF Transcript_9386/g.15318 Transcript_9386/m.15318 type:complete len:233 (+) Transcript_9386:167-865(+)
MIKELSFVVAAGSGLVYLWYVRRPRVHLGHVVADKYVKLCQGNNEFLLVRHGQSKANTAGVISSHPTVGTVQHPLTTMGVLQAERAAAKIEQIAQYQDIVIVASDFLRTRGTADVISKHLGVPVITSERIRERFFGTLDGESDENYQKVWDHDQYSVFHTEYQVESVHALLSRAATYIVDLDKMYSGKTIVVVAHGDVLQIVRTAFENKLPPALHREGPHLQTGSVTRLAIN